MQAFHGDLKIKDKYLSRVMAHAAADRLVQGVTWEHGKGCAIGCTLESYDHAQYPIELGIPKWLAYLEDKIFEGLPKENAMEWPTKFLAAIHVGADLEKIKAPFMIMILESTLDKFDHKKNPEVLSAVENVIALYKKGDATAEDFIKARVASRAADAYAAAAAAAYYAAAYAAAAAAAYYAAAYAADAADAADAAAAAYAADAAADAYADAADAAYYAAAYAADAAYYAAAYAADAADAARKNAYIKFADKLLELLGNCK